MARFEALARVDPSPETAVYARYMIRAVKEQVAPVPTPDAGCWNDALSSVALFYCRADAEDDEPRDDDELAASFQALIAASYWEVVGKGAAERDTLEVARKLARKAKWAQIADCLDELAEVRREVGAA